MLPNDLDRANELIQAGQTDQAMQLLARILKNEPRNELAWVLLASCVDDEQKQLDCLERVLSINPKNSQALIKYNRLKRKQRKASLSAADSRKASVSKKSSTKNPKEGSEASVPQEQPSKPRRRTRNITVEVEQNAEPLGRKSAKSSTTPPKSTPKPKSTSGGSAGKKPPKIADQQKIKAQQKNEIFSPHRRLSHLQEFVGDPALQIEQVDNGEDTTQTALPETGLPISETENNSFFSVMGEFGVVSRVSTGQDGYSLLVDGVRIRPSDAPLCLQSNSDYKEWACDYCDFYSPANCLLKADSLLREDVQRIYSIWAERAADLEQKRIDIIEAIHSELKLHGRPLHYTVIAQILRKRHPHLKVTERGVYRFITGSPHLFERLERGVYRAK